MDSITPKDANETKVLNIGQRITVALGIVIAAAGTLLASVGGLDWITANLPLLGTGLGSLVGGGITAYVAVRRMRLDKLAKGAGLAALLLIPFLLAGCAGVYTPKLSAISWGLDSSQILSGLNVTRSNSPTNDYYEIILDASNGQQSSGKLIDGLIAIGEIAARAKGLPVSGTAVSSGTEADSADTAPAEVEQQVVYSADGYGGAPGPSGEGIYGRPSCARCRAYRAAHPEVALVNIDDAANRADMWAALRLRGHTGASAALPVAVTAAGYTFSAK